MYPEASWVVFSSIREMSWWSSNQSNMINGTDGAVFHPLINRNELLYIFAADLCRCVRRTSFPRLKFVYSQKDRSRARSAGVRKLTLITRYAADKSLSVQ